MNPKTLNYFIKQHTKMEHKEVIFVISCENSVVSCKGHWFFQSETETNYAD